MMRFRRYLLVASGIIVAGFLVYCVIGVVGAVRSYPERHAKSCLTTFTQLADEALDVAIPAGRYSDAIDSADSISSSYPVGTVLPADHPFAAKYNEERLKQISRITKALKAATGMDHGHDWEAWKNAVANADNSIQ